MNKIFVWRKVESYLLAQASTCDF